MPPPIIRVVVPGIGEDRHDDRDDNREGVHSPIAAVVVVSPSDDDHDDHDENDDDARGTQGDGLAGGVAGGTRDDQDDDFRGTERDEENRGEDEAEVEDHDDDGGDDDDDDDVDGTTVLSLSSDTSATSIASDISDGIARERPVAIPPSPRIAVATGGRPRSASLGMPVHPLSPPTPINRPFRISTTNDDRRRPTSNPRSLSSSSWNARYGTNVTPLRRGRSASFGPLGASFATIDDGARAARRDDPSIVADDAMDLPTDDGVVGGEDEGDAIGYAPDVDVDRRTAMIGGRVVVGDVAAAMPPSAVLGEGREAMAMAAAESDAVDPLAPPPPRVRHPRSEARLRLAARVPPHPSTRDDVVRRHAHASSHGKSCKQRPSHRKLRRWDNDNFVGTHMEGLHARLSSDDDANYWREHNMPNYPRGYVSEFSRLVTDASESGRNVRDRFARGEVATPTIAPTTTMERAVLERFRKLGINVVYPPSTECDVAIVGSGLYRALCPRLRSVLSRSCAVARDDNDDGLDGARRTIAAFEGYLVSLALLGYGGASDARGEVGGGPKVDDAEDRVYPPVQSRDLYDLFGRVLSRPPRIVLRSETAMRRIERTSDRSLPASLVPAVRFHFATEDNCDGNGDDDGKRGNSGRVGRSSAFHRILLHSVCKFHGLESASSIVYTNKCGLMGDRKKHNGRGGGGMLAEKVVTVQAGVLLAPALRLLDYVQ